MSIENYEIALNDVDPTNLGAVKDLLETHSHLFNDYFLAGYGGDARYSVIDGSFEVIGIGDGFFEYEVGINFYAGCSGMNDTLEDQGMLEYEVRDGSILIEVDEAVWRVDN
ncbi:hypothetical protein P3Y99_000010 [Salmonella enterica]|nr:hypothetical protein [Salmonella enterica subsp. enterica serovar Give]EDA1427437.1 hypothetical protein [Salmonella enterica subsp. enterica serovar Give]EDZ8741128.1 hypothetical protein [Salmonella enterica subsp. enterica serovar Give]EKP8043230.1 hypothetical protein [Salmonella enterica]